MTGLDLLSGALQVPRPEMDVPYQAPGPSAGLSGTGTWFSGVQPSENQCHQEINHSLLFSPRSLWHSELLLRIETFVAQGQVSLQQR